jgi:hypothetical protein
LRFLQVAAMGHYVPYKCRSRLKRLAVEMERSIEDLMREALSDLFAKHAQP